VEFVRNNPGEPRGKLGERLWKKKKTVRGAWIEQGGAMDCSRWMKQIRDD